MLAPGCWPREFGLGILAMKQMSCLITTCLFAVGIFTVTDCFAQSSAEGVVRITDSLSSAPSSHVQIIRVKACGTSENECCTTPGSGQCADGSCSTGCESGCRCSSGPCGPGACLNCPCGCQSGGCENGITIGDCQRALNGCLDVANDCWLDRCANSRLGRWWHSQSMMYKRRNERTSRALICGLCPTGCCETALAGKYRIVYPADPHYADQRDGGVYSAQGYGVPVTVPLAPNVRHTYNYGWGVPSSRLTPVSHPLH